MRTNQLNWNRNLGNNQQHENQRSKINEISKIGDTTSADIKNVHARAWSFTHTHTYKEFL